MPEAERIDWVAVDFSQYIDMAKRGQAEFPREGFFKLRFKRRGPWLPARIYRPLPLDPDTGELLDRWLPLQGELNGHPYDYRKIWTRGQDIGKDEYEWLTALSAIRK